MKRRMLAISLVVLGLCVLAASAAAQITEDGTQDFFKINYFSNNGVSGAPDATVRIDNPGSPTAVVLEPEPDIPTDGGDTNLCAMIYVFDNDQQLSECCGCLVTPNGLRTLSVRHDLTGNPLTGVVSNNGVIKIVSAELNNSPCDPTTSFVIVPTIRAWASHVQNKVGSAYPVTETPFSNATLSEQELSFNLIAQCSFAQRLGSGHGICSCGTGD